MDMGDPPPSTIAREFVRQYYTLLSKEPQSMRRFYANDSYLIHGGFEDDLSDCQETFQVSGIQAIDERFKRTNFKHCKTKIRHVDAQPTIDNGLVIQVSGDLSKYAHPIRRFSQTFVLAMKIPGNYYLRNDIFRYQDNNFFDASEEQDFLAENQNELMKGQINQSVQQFPLQTIKQVPLAGPPAVDDADFPKEQPNQPGYLEPKKEGPLLNGGHEHQGEVVGQMAARHVAEAGGNLTGPQLINSASPQANPLLENPEAGFNIQDHPTSAPQPSIPAVGATETESSEDSADDIHKEDGEAPGEKTEKVQHQEPPPPVEPQGPPTYANLVKSGPTSAIGHNLVVSKPPSATAPPGTVGGLTSGSNSVAGGPPSSREFKESNSGYSGQGLNHGSGKFQRNRQGMGNQRGGPGNGGRDRDRDRDRGDRDRDRDRERDRDRFYQNNDGPNQDGQDRRRTIGGGMGPSNISPFPDSHQVFVGNLPHYCTEEELDKLFSKFGKVGDVRISGKGTGQSKTTATGQRVPNFGFVAFVDEKSVSVCLSKRPILLDDKHRLNVETKKNKPVRGENQGDQGGSGQNRGSQEHLGNIGRNSENNYRSRGGPRVGGGQRGGGGPGNSGGGSGGGGPCGGGGGGGGGGGIGTGGGGGGSGTGGGNTGSRSGGRGSQDGSRSGAGGGDSRAGQSGGSTRTYQRRS